MIDDMRAIQQGRNWTPGEQTGPPCGADEWCSRVKDNPLSERRHICIRGGCDKIVVRDHVVRIKTGLYLDIITRERAMPGYVRHGFRIGAFDETDLGIIGSGVAFSGR